jgi:hypothetical protein
LPVAREIRKAKIEDAGKREEERTTQTPRHQEEKTRKARQGREGEDVPTTDH